MSLRLYVHSIHGGAGTTTFACGLASILADVVDPESTTVLIDDAINDDCSAILGVQQPEGPLNVTSNFVLFSQSLTYRSRALDAVNQHMDMLMGSVDANANIVIDGGLRPMSATLERYNFTSVVVLEPSYAALRQFCSRQAEAVRRHHPHIIINRGDLHPFRTADIEAITMLPISCWLPIEQKIVTSSDAGLFQSRIPTEYRDALIGYCTASLGMRLG